MIHVVRSCVQLFAMIAVMGVGNLSAAEPAIGTSERPLKIAILSGSGEYESAITMPVWKEKLEQEYYINCDLLQAEKEIRIDGLERLKDADLAVFFTRRIKMPAEELAPLKEYIASKKPIIGLRTASHGFQEYLEFDREILGGNYKNHYGKGDPTTISIIPAAKDHPVLWGIATETPWKSEYSMYRTAPLADDSVPLLMASSPAADREHPAAWVREADGRRVFYTALGGRTDFDDPRFQTLLMNAICWTTEISLPERIKRNSKR